MSESWSRDFQVSFLLSGEGRIPDLPLPATVTQLRFPEGIEPVTSAVSFLGAPSSFLLSAAREAHAGYLVSCPVWGRHYQVTPATAQVECHLKMSCDFVAIGKHPYPTRRAQVAVADGGDPSCTVIFDVETEITEVRVHAVPDSSVRFFVGDPRWKMDITGDFQSAMAYVTETLVEQQWRVRHGAKLVLPEGSSLSVQGAGLQGVEVLATHSIRAA